MAVQTFVVTFRGEFLEAERGSIPFTLEDVRRVEDGFSIVRDVERLGASVSEIFVGIMVPAESVETEKARLLEELQPVLKRLGEVSTGNFEGQGETEARVRVSQVLLAPETGGREREILFEISFYTRTTVGPAALASFTITQIREMLQVLRGLGRTRTLQAMF